ncbi:hypothetical protein RLEG3_03100 (plasmid) [Rhizobium leguminosarum bv. trifolii WSM1689]|nr:hypothetical protein RLEG3_03100 [Rhizobium leguminosarum bv. trifolii WSM1689]
MITANSKGLRRGTRGCIGLIGQSRISRFRRFCAFNICATINSGMIRVDRHRRGMTVKKWPFGRWTLCSGQLVFGGCFGRLGDG